MKPWPDMLPTQMSFSEPQCDSLSQAWHLLQGTGYLPGLGKRATAFTLCEEQGYKKLNLG